MSIYHSESRFAYVNAYFALNVDPYSMPFHQHPRCEITYITQGQCTVETLHTSDILNQGMFVFIDEGVNHRVIVEKGRKCSLMNIEFPCRNVQIDSFSDLCFLKKQSKYFASFLESKQAFLILNDTGNLGYALRDLIRELEFRDKDNNFIIGLLLTRTLHELAKCALFSKSATGFSYLRKAQSYIREYYNAELDVKVIAEHAGIHPAYLQKLFNRNFGYGVMTYVNRIRLQKAAFLLINSDKSITDIAFSVGFNSRQNFGHAFECYYSSSPLKYRKKAGTTAHIDTIEMKEI